MKITLNLATRPYIELRPIYARLRLIMLVLAILALPMLLVLRVEQAKAREATARVDQLKHNIQLLQMQQRNAQALMQEPDNAGVLTQADFLNELFRRKAFSWTATMSDLETTLPSGVQVLSIDPVVAADGHVTIRLRVSGARERAVEVVRNLEHSRHFLAPRLASEALANQGGTGASVRQVSETGGAATDVAFDILADYRPLPHSHDRSGGAKRDTADASATQSGSADQQPAPAELTAAPPSGPAGARPSSSPARSAAASARRGSAPQGVR